MSAKARLVEAIQKIEAAQEAFEKNAKETVGAVFTEFFAENPEVHAIKWSQYTPYFNDGDICEFGVNDFYFQPTDETARENEDSDYGDGFYSTYNDSPSVRTASNAVDNFQALFNGQAGSDLLGAAFGDHAEIVATRDGFEVESYDHE